DRNRSHWSTSKTPSYTKSVSWQHHQQGNVNTSYPFESPCPNGTETVAMYHTHGSDSNGVYGDEVFSPADKELSKNKAISSYLGTPKGSFQKVELNGDQPMNKSGLPSQCRVHANGEIY
ncbi:DUF4329 domain-containing protein, partial [Escherichia coli]|nr:DUF4329 domain-containing protein [Escherichia coli]MCV5339937.1 DUF4329 domain-containing protein [Escherichia coli]MCV5387537.1 DUF4329 domain-containing protein [Escherichia coli]